MPDPKHARAEVRLCGVMIEEQAGVAPQMGCVERVSHDQEHVHVLWFYLVGDKRSKYHEPRQVTGRSSHTVDAREAEGQRLSPSRSDAELVENLAQRCWKHVQPQANVEGREPRLSAPAAS